MSCKHIQDEIVASAGPATEWSPDVRTHLETCDRCRAVAQRVQTLDAELARAADDLGETPPELHERIMAGVADADRETHVFRLRPVLALAASLAILLGLAAWGVSRLGGNEGGAHIAHHLPAVQVPAADVTAYSRLAAQLAADASVAAASPLNQEWKRLKADVTNAGNYLLASL